MATATPPTETVPSIPSEIRTLLDRAHQGDTSTLPALRKLLDDPRWVDGLGGNLAWQAERSLIDAVAGTDLTVREALTRKLVLLRDELAGMHPTPLERLLVERIVACWLQV